MLPKCLLCWKDLSLKWKGIGKPLCFSDRRRLWITTAVENGSVVKIGWISFLLCAPCVNVSVYKCGFDASIHCKSWAGEGLFARCFPLLQTQTHSALTSLWYFSLSLSGSKKASADCGFNAQLHNEPCTKQILSYAWYPGSCFLIGSCAKRPLFAVSMY